ncbi:hypothetical protein DSECCO2_623780 [anaerobic digester metagenome]
MTLARTELRLSGSELMRLANWVRVVVDVTSTEICREPTVKAKVPDAPPLMTSSGEEKITAPMCMSLVARDTTSI